MAYNPFALVHKSGSRSKGPDVPSTWRYTSTDAMTSVRAAGYISDATLRGMKPFDTVEVVTVNGGGVIQTFVISVVLSITAGAADLSDGTAITLTNTEA